MAFCSFVINDSFLVGNVAIHKRYGPGYRLNYPSHLLKTGVRVDSFKPLNKEAGEAIERTVLLELERVFEKVKKSGWGTNGERATAAGSEI